MSASEFTSGTNGSDDVQKWAPQPTSPTHSVGPNASTADPLEEQSFSSSGAISVNHHLPPYVPPVYHYERAESFDDLSQHLQQSHDQNHSDQYFHKQDHQSPSVSQLSGTSHFEQWASESQSATLLNAPPPLSAKLGAVNRRASGVTKLQAHSVTGQPVRLDRRPQSILNISGEIQDVLGVSGVGSGPLASVHSGSKRTLGPIESALDGDGTDSLLWQSGSQKQCLSEGSEQHLLQEQQSRQDRPDSARSRKKKQKPKYRDEPTMLSSSDSMVFDHSQNRGLGLNIGMSHRTSDTVQPLLQSSSNWFGSDVMNNRNAGFTTPSSQAQPSQTSLPKMPPPSIPRPHTVRGSPNFYGYIQSPTLGEAFPENPNDSPRRNAESTTHTGSGLPGSVGHVSANYSAVAQIGDSEQQIHHLGTYSTGLTPLITQGVLSTSSVPPTEVSGPHTSSSETSLGAQSQGLTPRMMGSWTPQVRSMPFPSSADTSGPDSQTQPPSYVPYHHLVEQQQRQQLHQQQQKQKQQKQKQQKQQIYQPQSSRGSRSSSQASLEHSRWSQLDNQWNVEQPDILTQTSSEPCSNSLTALSSNNESPPSSAPPPQTGASLAEFYQEEKSPLYSQWGSSTTSASRTTYRPYRTPPLPIPVPTSTTAQDVSYSAMRQLPKNQKNDSSTSTGDSLSENLPATTKLSETIPSPGRSTPLDKVTVASLPATSQSGHTTRNATLDSEDETSGHGAFNVSSPEDEDTLMKIPSDNYSPVAKEAQWSQEAVRELMKLLEPAERYKWKFISDTLSQHQNKRIPLRACRHKFEALFGEAEASSALQSSLFYVAYRSGWDTIRSIRTAEDQEAEEEEQERVDRISLQMHSPPSNSRQQQQAQQQPQQPQQRLQAPKLSQLHTQVQSQTQFTSKLQSPHRASSQRQSPIYQTQHSSLDPRSYSAVQSNRSSLSPISKEQRTHSLDKQDPPSLSRESIKKSRPSIGNEMDTVSINPSGKVSSRLAEPLMTGSMYETTGSNLSDILIVAPDQRIAPGESDATNKQSRTFPSEKSADSLGSGS